MNFGGEPALDRGVNENRDGGGTGTGGEEADDEIIQAQGESEQRASHDAGPQ